ncbi:MAG: DegT/DnrJ/EryC1/StrS family aminotransferase [Deltaproteobacteria bacterium]|nr:DegT/DnrJ/EryC1/StrS family aminotransferase [Deltaproteobacteria bacterium]
MAKYWFYEMVDLGYNYRITDIQCALGISQLQKLPEFLRRRREIAALYDEALEAIPGTEPLGLRADVLPAMQSAWRMAQSEDRPSPSSSDPLLSALCSLHSYHLYVVRVNPGASGVNRTAFFTNLRERGIGVNVHYIPVHLHPFYRNCFGTGPGLCPVAEAAYEQVLSLPMFPGMTDDDVENVIKMVQKVIDHYKTGAC